ncbi:MAG: glycosyltransferase family 1 protein [Prolixibacteraceae bacterium]
MTRILIDGRLLTDNPTGISRYTREIIQALSEKYGKDNITVLVSKNLRFKPDGHIVETKLKPYNPLHFFLFPFFINRLEFETYYSTFYSGLYFLRAKRKQILTVHDLMYLRIEKYFSNSAPWNWLSTAMMNGIVRLSLRASDLVISVSETTQKDLEEIFHQDSVVIGEGINQLEERPATAEPLMKRLQLEKEKYFLYVGNFRKQKNTGFLVEAFLKSNSPHKLVMVGEKMKPQRDRPNIIYTGILPDHEIQALYQNALAFVLPSLYEGFGLPILEAYAAGTRVFSSNRGALKEFRDLKISYFSPVDPNELVYLLQNAANIPRQTASDIDLTRDKYSWKKQTNKLLDSIESLRSTFPTNT